MSGPKAVFFALFVVMFFSSFGFATPVPAHAEFGNEFDIVAEDLIFTPFPWNQSNGGTISFNFYTVYDYELPPDGILRTNFMGYGSLSDGGHTFIDFGKGSGDLAIKFFNSSMEDSFLDETVLTVSFKQGHDPIDIYLPHIDLAKQEEMHLWIADDGSTYYANVTGAEGIEGQNMTAAESIAAGDVARVPEPATLAIIGLGGFFCVAEVPVSGKSKTNSLTTHSSRFQGHVAQPCNADHLVVFLKEKPFPVALREVG